MIPPLGLEPIIPLRRRTGPVPTDWEQRFGTEPIPSGNPFGTSRRDIEVKVWPRAGSGVSTQADHLSFIYRPPDRNQ